MLTSHTQSRRLKPTNTGYSKLKSSFYWIVLSVTIPYRYYSYDPVYKNKAYNYLYKYIYN